jgi:hypothetical protein
MKIKSAILNVTLALGFLSSSCLGPDNAYGSIKNWNADLSGQDWVNEAVFIGLYIIPVYPIALLGDVLIFNTVQYWSGDNLINDPGPFKGFARGD